MSSIASTTRHASPRLLGAAALTAFAAVGVLASILSSPDALVRLATRDVISAAAPREARVTVSTTGDIVVPLAEALVAQPALAAGEKPMAPSAVFSVGDRMTITSSDGKQRVLEVIEVTNDGAPSRGAQPESSTHISGNLAIVTCRVVDETANPARSEVIRFLAPTTPGTSQHPLPVSFPGTNAPTPRVL